MNIFLLNRLQEAQGAYLTLETLGPDVRALGRDLDALEVFGFAIERHPLFGVAYRGPAPRLCPDQIEAGLNTKRIGRQVAVWSRIASTNDLAARASRSIANEGLVILAEEQTAGRGRRGRVWIAPHGACVLMSVLIFPQGSLAEPGWLTALGAIAVAEVVSSYIKAEARIKWPNDVRVNGRKIAGILVERGAGAVIGIGLNANVWIEEFPEELRDTVTSLQILTGRPVDRSILARDLIQKLDGLYGRCLAEGAEVLSARWQEHSESLGHRVRVMTSGHTFEGTLNRSDPVEGIVLQNTDQAPVHIPASGILGIVDENEPKEL